MQWYSISQAFDAPFYLRTIGWSTRITTRASLSPYLSTLCILSGQNCAPQSIVLPVEGLPAQIIGVLPKARSSRLWTWYVINPTSSTSCWYSTAHGHKDTEISATDLTPQAAAAQLTFLVDKCTAQCSKIYATYERTVRRRSGRAPHHV